MLGFISTHIESGSVSMGEEPQRLSDHLFLFRLQLLIQVKLSAHNDEWNLERFDQISVLQIRSHIVQLHFYSTDQVIYRPMRYLHYKLGYTLSNEISILQIRLHIDQ